LWSLRVLEVNKIGNAIVIIIIIIIIIIGGGAVIYHTERRGQEAVIGQVIDDPLLCRTQLAETTNNSVVALKARDLLLGRPATADMSALYSLRIQKVLFAVFVISLQVIALSAGKCICPHNAGDWMLFVNTVRETVRFCEV
jgi:hypothetical protein